MANNVQENWNLVQIVYGIGDPMVKMVNKEQTCSFHWIQYFYKHTKSLITPKFHDQHKAIVGLGK